MYISSRSEKFNIFKLFSLFPPISTYFYICTLIFHIFLHMYTYCQHISTHLYLFSPIFTMVKMFYCPFILVLAYNFPGTKEHLSYGYSKQFEASLSSTEFLLVSVTSVVDILYSILNLFEIFNF